jgi:hypothetical protein
MTEQPALQPARSRGLGIATDMFLTTAEQVSDGRARAAGIRRKESLRRRGSF